MKNAIYLTCIAINNEALNGAFNAWVNGLETQNLNGKSSVYAIDRQASTIQDGKFYHSISLHSENPEWGVENPRTLLNIAQTWPAEITNGSILILVE